MYSYLREKTIVDRGSKTDNQQMPEKVEQNIYAGKKELMVMITCREIL
ncbi:MAG TPA: hypothetical protein VM012_12640 [Flavitalea sp.]|nr:hypothetical protein [Flavitalea sp.]